MEGLPAELISRILWFAEKNRKQANTSKNDPSCPLSPFATISRQWQHLVEPITFRKLDLTPDGPSAGQFFECLTPIRLSYIRRVSYRFSLNHDEPIAAAEDYQSVFNHELTRLFGFLTRLPRYENPHVTLRIVIPSSITDGQSPFRLQLANQIPEVNMRYIELDQYWSLLPELLMISCFDVCRGSTVLHFAPSSICRLSSKMERLKDVSWILSDDEKADPDIRVQQRTAFAQSLELLPRSVEDFFLLYHRQSPYDQSFDVPSIIPPDSPEDILSQELRRLTQRDGILRVSLMASLDSTIFWPANETASDSTFWPTLEKLEVYFTHVLPSGEWVAERDINMSPESPEPPKPTHCDIPGEEFINFFRFRFDQQVMDRFLLAGARAASNMPKVIEFALRNAPNNWPKGGFSLRDRSHHPDTCLVIYGEPEEPEPSSEVLDAWQKVAEAHNFAFKPYFTNDIDPMVDW